jgi:hypothetical protein
MARPRLRRWLLAIGAGVFALALLIQLVPYGWRHPNPPVTADAPWPSTQARRVAVAACYDCHSNETDWPWYSYIAPTSWLVRKDVEDGRDELNFSTWDEDDNDADDAIETIEDASMPPRQYKLLHPDARLTADERALLIEALRVMEGERDDAERGGGGPGPG